MTKLDVNYYDKFVKKRIPILNWLPNYQFNTFLQDFLAGLTVGMTEIPQGIAYAVVAGLSPEYGLYSGLLDGFIYAIFGSCKDLNIGPTSLLSLMLQPHVAKMGPDSAVLLTFLSGIIIFLLGVLHLGFLVQFFSYPIVAGFICAGSLQIASSQIKNLFGISGKADAFLESWISVFEHFDEVKMWDTILGLTSLLLLFMLKEIGRFGALQHKKGWSKTRNVLGRLIFMLSLSRNALIVVIGTLIAYKFRDANPFKITGAVTGGFPHIKPPPFNTNFSGTYYDFMDLIGGYGASIAFMPLISILEAISIAKAFSQGKKLDATQEMLALGLCNMVGSFASSMPVTGSFTRSAVNNASGVKTPLAGAFTSSLLLLSIAFLTPSFYYVPKATLAAIIICAMFYLFDFGAFVILWRTKKTDFIPFLATFFSCLFISIEYGILIGTAVNLLFILYASARPKFNVVKEKKLNNEGDVYIVTPKDTLYFPAAEYLRDTVLEFEGQEVTVVINGKFIRTMDVTVAKSLAILTEELLKKKQNILFLDFKSSVVNVCTEINKNLRNYFLNEGQLMVNFIRQDQSSEFSNHHQVNSRL